MINNHYIKNQVLEPSDLTREQKLVWNVLQMDTLMDLEFIYNEIRNWCSDFKDDMCEYANIKDALYFLKEHGFIEEITEHDINLILIKRRMKQMESPKYITCSANEWGL